MRAIGFSRLIDRREQQKLITNIILSAKHRSYTSNGEDTILAEFCEDFADNLGVSVCGEFDAEDKFTYDYFYPYLRGKGVSSYEDVSVERHAEKESYAGICDDIKVGVSLIFYLQNMIPYVKAQYMNLLPIKGTTLTLSALSIKGNIILPITKNEREVQRVKKASHNRNQLIAAARQGDEDAIESLTLEDIDTYSMISRRIANEDILSIVDSYFMPHGIESDQYSILGEILNYYYVSNSFSQDRICVMTVDTNDLVYNICINENDLVGVPAVGRRFKGNIWMQGTVNIRN